MRTFRCNGVSCICAVVVRYGDDVVVIDNCRGKLKIRFPSNKKLNPAFIVTREAGGRQFNVCLYIGILF